MQLKTKDGISCDACATKYRSKFSYFSASGNVIILKNRMPIKTSKKLEFDLCDICYRKWCDKILDHVADARQGFIKDDFSNEFFDAGEYVSFILTKVDVDQGGVKTNQDIDITIGNNSLKELIKTLTNVKDHAGDDEWTMT